MIKPWRLTIVIPCLNESETIRFVVKRALKMFQDYHYIGEVLVVDNGSIDKSIQIATKAGARVVRCPIKGYGAALRYGFAQATGDILIMGDADGSYDFREVPEFIETFHNHKVDVVIGSRLRGVILPGAMPFLHRYFGTPMLTAINNLFFASHFTDCNSGMRAFKTKALKKMHLESDGMELATEILIKTAILHLPYAEVPITYRPDLRTKRRSHLHTFRDGWRHFKFLVLYAPHKVFVWPGMVCFLLGSFLVISQANGKITLGRFYFDFHFMILGIFIGLLGLVLVQMGIGLELLSKKKGFPVGSTSDYFASFFHLERMLFLGFGIFCVGLLIDAIILVQWIRDGFDKVIYFRPALIATYAMTIGIQMVFYAIFYAILSKYKIEK